MDYSTVPMDSGAATGVGIVMIIVYLLLAVIMIASLWKIFVKAGKPGWAAIVPIYNLIIMLEIVGKPIWWIILFLIPFANLIVAILIYIELAKKFGKEIGFAIGMILLPIVFFPILGFGSAEYKG
ncbi:MAG: DUF5684 domain-containing protein [Bacteroidota bacterium]